MHEITHGHVAQYWLVGSIPLRRSRDWTETTWEKCPEWIQPWTRHLVITLPAIKIQKSTVWLYQLYMCSRTISVIILHLNNKRSGIDCIVSCNSIYICDLKCGMRGMNMQCLDTSRLSWKQTFSSEAEDPQREKLNSKIQSLWRAGSTWEDAEERPEIEQRKQN